MHISGFTTAVPILTAVFSSADMGFIAPAGQMSAQVVHSGRQYPAVNSITGCMNELSDDDGFRTPLGHALIQSWQAVQWLRRCATLMAPGGTAGAAPATGFLAFMGARPPSVALSAARRASDPAMIVEPTRNALRRVSGAPVGLPTVALRRGAKEIAPCEHAPMQSIQSTHRDMSTM